MSNIEQGISNVEGKERIHRKKREIGYPGTICWSYGASRAGRPTRTHTDILAERYARLKYKGTEVGEYYADIVVELRTSSFIFQLFYVIWTKNFVVLLFL